MKDFDGYKRLKEPEEKKKKIQNWKTAIGLQAVDGLVPSDYLIETAKKNIEGEISIYEVEKRINNYYREKNERNIDNRVEEADKVSTKITEILNEKAFSFSVTEIINIHKRLFSTVLNELNSRAQAGKIRDYNISKREWILDGESVYYASFNNIIETLSYDLKQEKEFSYKGLNKNEVINHIARFTSDIWQIHPFGEGNTRTIAVFIIKYLRMLGFEVNNQLFAENSWYFRNALVRANYTNYGRNIHTEFKYLNYFFENLLLKQDHELKNRNLKIYANSNQMENTKFSEVLELIKKDKKITAIILSKKLNKGIATIKRELKRLKDDGYISRVGSDKTGSWKILK